MTPGKEKKRDNFSEAAELSLHEGMFYTVLVLYPWVTSNCPNCFKNTIKNLFLIFFT